MKNSKNTRRALVLSVLSVVMCLAMLIGTTFAWFTDTASTSVSTIQAGTLNVEIQGANNESIEKLNWVKAEGHADEAILWEPGCTYNLESFKIVNTGNLALKYKIVVTDATGDKKLLDVIHFTYTADGQDLDISQEGHLAAGDETGLITVSAHMDESAGNEYQGLKLEGVAIKVYATQDTVEYDSDSNQYDQNAEYPVIVKSNSEAEGELKQDKEAINVALENDVTVDVKPYDQKPLGGASTKVITIDGQGHKLIFNNTNSDWNNVTWGNAKLIIKNAIIDNSGYSADGGSWNSHDITFKGNVELENVVFTNAVALNGKAVLKNVIISDAEATQDTYMLWIVAGSNVTLDNCTINGKSNVGKSNRAIAIKDQYVDNPGLTTLTINGGKISSDKKAAVIVTSKGGATINVTGDVDITEVSADSNNLVWKDKDPAYAGSVVTVTGATCITEP